MRSGSKTISTASACPGWLLYVGCSFFPPVYPTVVEMTPSRRRSSSCTPQKQPAARMAVSVLSFMVSLFLRRAHDDRLGDGHVRSRVSLGFDRRPPPRHDDNTGRSSDRRPV